VPPDQTPAADTLRVLSDRVFGADGPLAQVLPGYEPRQAQREMAAAVSDVLDEGGVLLVEAGTGTGKTVAYLVPAILKGEQVIVSTGTKNLQEQILLKDLPVLEQAIGRPFTAVCMKGRGNYLCLQRFEALQQETATGAHLPMAGLGAAERREWIRVIGRWARVTETGDRAELTELADDLPIWKDIAATVENCLGSDCPRYHECFITRMRHRAAEADVVIVNHHLLFADAALRQHADASVIPDAPHAVLDEAHQLEDIATQYFGVAVTAAGLDDVASDLDRWAARVLRPPHRDAVTDGAHHLRRAARRLFMVLETARTGPDERVRLSPDALHDAAEAGGDLHGLLEGLEATLLLLQQAGGDVPLVDGEALEDLLGLARRLKATREDVRFLLKASDPEFVYFLEVRGRSAALRAVPIDVSALVRDAVITRRRATVLTSATLAIEGSFEYVRSRLGVGPARELRLESEFDYRRQALLYLPRTMPPPRSPAFAPAAAETIADILRRTRGRAFVLFTSYAMLRFVESALAGSLDYPLLVQGEAPRSALVERFRQTPNAVLLATSSFWQGVDVVGEALSCVIVDKLPFASPADPVTAARLEAIAARGGDPFSDYQVPLAILTLQQGLGRLLRHRRDRGVLAVLDPRLRTMGYGRRFLAALPPAPQTLDPARIDAFFAADDGVTASRASREREG
jgi:ATP-dependent DNA helicase DinG